MSEKERPSLLYLSAIHPEQLDGLKQNFNVVSVTEFQENPELYAQKITALETFTTQKVDADLIDSLPNLEIIASSAVGYDNIDLQYAFEKGIRVSYTPDIVTESTANVGIMHLLQLTRQGVAFDEFVRENKWQSKDDTPYGVSLVGKKIGIVGLGRIGQSVADKARAFGLEVLYTSRTEKPDQENAQYYEDVEALAHDSDFLIACCNLNEETQGIISKNVLEALGPKGFFVNIARGGVVDQDALIKALNNNKIAGAGLDVFDDEPNVPETLKNMPKHKVTLSPHIGSKDYETRVEMGAITIRNLLAHFAGQPLPNPVPGSP